MQTGSQNTNTGLVQPETASPAPFRFFMPTELYFGPGQVQRVGEVARKFGTRALFVTGRRAMRESGILDRVLGHLRDAGVEAVVFDRVTPNPLSTTVDEGAALARERRCDLVIGLGGGSAIDAAKGMAVAATNPGGIWHYSPLGDRAVPQQALPIVAVATTAGTGTEVDRYAVITNPATREKPGFAMEWMQPRAAIVDPELMLGVPPRTTAATGLDVLFHSVEAYLHRSASPASDLTASQAIRLVARWLPEAYRRGGNLEARYWMAWASTLAGVAINTAGTVLIHAMEHPLSGHYGVVHAEGLAALSQAVLEYDLPAARERLADVAVLLGAPQRDAEQALERIRQLRQAVDLDVRLRDLGAREEDIPALAADCLRTMGGGVQANLRPADAAAIEEIYRRAL